MYTHRGEPYDRSGWASNGWPPSSGVKVNQSADTAVRTELGPPPAGCAS